jgi:hypothetical protein
MQRSACSRNAKLAAAAQFPEIGGRKRYKHLLPRTAGTLTSILEFGSGYNPLAKECTLAFLKEGRF